MPKLFEVEGQGLRRNMGSGLRQIMIQAIDNLEHVNMFLRSYFKVFVNALDFFQSHSSNVIKYNQNSPNRHFMSLWIPLEGQKECCEGPDLFPG